MKQLTLFIALMLASVLAFSQTKRIAHRSHSGKDHAFNLLGPDNFGLPAEKEKPKPKTDKKANPKKDSLKTVPPAKTDTIIKNVPQPVTKEEVYRVLLAVQKRYRSIGLL